MELEKMDIEAVMNSLKRLNTNSSERTIHCETCQDQGWIYSEDENGYRYVKECVCQKARRAESLLRASGLSDAIDRETFDAFIVKTPMQKRLKETAQAYLNVILTETDNPRKPWLYIGGNPGSGKTHICTAVCGELLKHGVSVRYIQWLDVSRRLKAVINEPDFDSEVEPYINTTVLYIDDLLKQKYTENPSFSEADIKIAFTILNSRYLLNKPTIISSEWDLLSHLLPADEGVFSRVYERCKGYMLNIERNFANNYRLSGGR